VKILLRICYARSEELDYTVEEPDAAYVRNA